MNRMSGLNGGKLRDDLVQLSYFVHKAQRRKVTSSRFHSFVRA